MLKSALGRIDFMVMNSLHPENLTSKSTIGSNLENFIEIIKEAQKEIRISLMNQFFSDQKEKKLELFVQRCQASLIHFTDTLFEYSNLSLIPEVRKVYQSIIKIFEELLNFIQYRFSAYFNLDAEIPMSYQNVCEVEFKTQLELFSSNIKKHKIDKNLLNIIIQSFESFYKQDTTKDLTFRRLNYLKKLLSSLIEKTKPRKIDNIDHKILVQLLYFNFNHTRVFNFITKLISTDLNELADNNQVIEKLHWYIKELNQMPLKPQMALYPDLPGLKEFCITWLYDELIFIKNKNLPALVIQPAAAVDPQPLETSLTVPQLALFIKLLIDEDIIKNSSYRQLSKITSRYFRTPYSDKLSAENLRLKTFSFEKHTVNKVKDVIIRLLNNVNKIKIHVSIVMLNYVLQEMLSALSEYV